MATTTGADTFPHRRVLIPIDQYAHTTKPGLKKHCENLSTDLRRLPSRPDGQAASRAGAEGRKVTARCCRTNRRWASLYVLLYELRQSVKISSPHERARVVPGRKEKEQ